MLTTENQAKVRWCPMARLADNEAAFNRDADGGLMPSPSGAPRANCIGSRCMMWRWGEPEAPKVPDTRRGYCGLAGKLGSLV